MTMELYNPSIEDRIDNNIDEAEHLRKCVSALIKRAHDLDEEVRALDPKVRRERNLHSEMTRLINSITRIGG